jgi:murein DD-endopeptidase MepM/ murein hydrolase activator NlpD
MLDAAQRKLRGARAELRVGQENVADQKNLIAAYVAELYEKGDPRLIGFAAIADAGDPGDMMRAIAFNDAYNDHENAVLGALEDAEQALATQEAKVEEREGEVAESRAAAADNLTAKERLEKQASAQRSEVQKLVDEKAAIHAVAAHARAADRAALARLHNEEKRIAAILRRRAQQALRNGAPGKSDGYLSYPVNGPITSPFGYRIHPIYGDRRLHNGVDFGAGCGQPLFAGADGVVVARGGGDWDPSGNYLFIDHGGVAGVGLSTSYSHATSYIVSVGQRVKRGQTVGYVGSTGWSTGCHLHFTVKENGVNVDPMKWL